jgi:anti-sigma factor RsiW
MIMPAHPSHEQLMKYRDRGLPPAELLSVDAHLGTCPDCRRGLAETANLASSNAMISAVREARADHLTYDQMDAWVEGELESSEREFVMAHIGLCPPCARQLQAYESYAPVMSAPVRIPPATPLTLVNRLRAFFSAPGTVALTAAAVAVAVLGPLAVIKRTESARSEFTASLRTGNTTSSTTPSLDTAELDAVPSSLRGGAMAALDTQSSERPAALAGLSPNSDVNLDYPVSEVIVETTPELRWKPFARSFYVASIYNSQRILVARSPMILQTHWQPPVRLTRGAIYTWEVQAAGRGLSVPRRASFRVLSQTGDQQLSELRAAHPAPLAMGAVAESLGLLSLARQEFEALKETQPQQGGLLLDHVTSLRGH